MKGIRLSLCSLCLALSGCAILSFTFDELPPAPPQASQPVGSLHVEIVDQTRLELFEGHWTDSASFASDRQVVEALQSSGLFSSVSTEKGFADFEASVLVSRQQSAPRPALLGLLTAYLIPAEADCRVLVQVSMARGDSPRARCTRYAAFHIWRELLFLPLLFTHWSPVHDWQAVRRMTQDCAHDSVAQLTTATNAPAPPAATTGGD